MKVWRAGIGVLALIAAGCAPSGTTNEPAESPSDPAPATVSSTSANSRTGEKSTEGSMPAQTTSVAVDPPAFADVGAQRYAFTLPSGSGVCWLSIGAELVEVANDLPPSVHCLLPIDSFGNVTDRRTGQVGEPTAAVIDGNGAWPSLTGPVGDGSPPVLNAGESLTVSHLTCEVNADSILRCLAQTGEFTFDGQTLEIVQDLPSPYVATGAGLHCGAVQEGTTMLPVYITAGKLSCETAIATMTKYLSIPWDERSGTLHEQSFDGWQCFSHSLGESQWYGTSRECRADGQRVIVPV